MKKITIDIADDHKMVLAGLKNILQAFPNMQVKNTYGCGIDLMKGLKKTQPDVLLLDIQMPDVSGEELAPLINKTYPDVRILVITGFDTTYYTKTMFQKGALGYLLKNTNEIILKQAIETVFKGERFLDPTMRDKLVQDVFEVEKNTTTPTLTRREKEILKLIMQEQTSQQIADKLHLSLRTVENQRVNLMQKLEVKNAVGLVKKTIEWKLLD